MAPAKEPQFFSFRERFSKGARKHNENFENCATASVYGESSQCYFTHTDAMDRIDERLADPRIILMLRDPIDRLVSQYKWNFRRSTEKESLRRAVMDRGDDIGYIYDERLGIYREKGGYVAFSRYSRWVPEWQKRFGEENVLILAFEDYIANQSASLAKIFDFLSVKQVTVPESHGNATDEALTKLIPPRYTFAARMLPRKWKQSRFYNRIKEGIKRWNTPSPTDEIDLELRDHLESELAEDIAMHRAYRYFR